MDAPRTTDDMDLAIGTTANCAMLAVCFGTLYGFSAGFVLGYVMKGLWG